MECPVLLFYKHKAGDKGKLHTSDYWQAADHWADDLYSNQSLFTRVQDSRTVMLRTRARAVVYIITRAGGLQAHQ